jgi:hypothetical protein
MGTDIALPVNVHSNTRDGIAMAGQTVGIHTEWSLTFVSLLPL